MPTARTLNNIPFSRIHQLVLEAQYIFGDNELRAIKYVARYLGINAPTLTNYLSEFTFKDEKLSYSLLCLLSIEQIKEEMPWKEKYEQYICSNSMGISNSKSTSTATARSKDQTREGFFKKLTKVPFCRIHKTLMDAAQSKSGDEFALAIDAAAQLFVEPATLIRYLANFTFNKKRLSCTSLSRLSIDEIKNEAPWSLDYEHYIPAPYFDIQHSSLAIIHKTLRNNLEIPIDWAIAQIGFNVQLVEKHLNKINLIFTVDNAPATCQELRQMSETNFKNKYSFSTMTIYSLYRQPECSQYKNTRIKSATSSTIPAYDEHEFEINLGIFDNKDELNFCFDESDNKKTNSTGVTTKPTMESRSKKRRLGLFDTPRSGEYFDETNSFDLNCETEPNLREPPRPQSG